MFPVTDNPAARLLEILNEAKSKSEDVSVIGVFSSILGFPENDRATFYRAIGYLNHLLDQLDFRIRQIPDINHNLFLRDIPSIRNVICPRAIKEPWRQYVSPLKFGALTSIEFCSNELQKAHTEVAIEQQTLNSLKKEIRDFYQNVLTSELDGDLKSILFDLITSIEISIENYRIHGVDGVKRAVTYAMGLMTLHQTRFESLKSTPLMKKAGVILKGLISTVNTAYQVSEIPDRVRSLLSLPE